MKPTTNKPLKSSFSTQNLQIETGTGISNRSSIPKNKILKQADRAVMKKATTRNTINLVSFH